MWTAKDVLIEFLLELLKEEREHRRKETEENASLIRDLVSRFEKLETDLIFELHTRNLYRRVGRTVCDGDVDEVDLWQYVTSGLCNNTDKSSGVFHNKKLDHDISDTVLWLVTIMLICQHDAILW